MNGVEEAAIVAFWAMVLYVLELAMKNKLWREVGFGGFEIVFIVALVGLIFGIAIRAWESSAERWVPWIISLALFWITAPACVAGWLGKIIFPKWEALAIRKAKYWAAGVGFTFVLVVIVMNVVVPHHTQSANACVNNLRLIDSAKDQWALEQRKQSTDTPAGSDLQPYLGRGTAGELPYCEKDTNSPPSFYTSYSINNLGTKPTCKICPTIHLLP